MNTPFFPAFRSRLAALGRRTTHCLRQATLGQFQDHIRDLLPGPAPVQRRRGTQQPGTRLPTAPDVRMLSVANAQTQDGLPRGGPPSPGLAHPAGPAADLGGRFGLYPGPPPFAQGAAGTSPRVHRPNRRSPGRSQPPTPGPSHQGRGRLLDSIGRHARQPTSNATLSPVRKSRVAASP